MDITQVKFCEDKSGEDNLSCLPENLILVEKLQDSENHEPNYKIENYLKTCRICGQIYRKEIHLYQNGNQTNIFHKIPGNLINDCDCTDHLIPLEVLKDEKWCEGDSMSFAMVKETKMQCRKCGTYYKERICQDNYGGHYSKKYSKL